MLRILLFCFRLRKFLQARTRGKKRSWIIILIHWIEVFNIWFKSTCSSKNVTYQICFFFCNFVWHLWLITINKLRSGYTNNFRNRLVYPFWIFCACNAFITEFCSIQYENKISWKMLIANPTLKICSFDIDSKIVTVLFRIDSRRFAS